MSFNFKSHKLYFNYTYWKLVEVLQGFSALAAKAMLRIYKDLSPTADFFTSNEVSLLTNRTITPKSAVCATTAA